MSMRRQMLPEDRAEKEEEEKVAVVAEAVAAAEETAVTEERAVTDLLVRVGIVDLALRAEIADLALKVATGLTDLLVTVVIAEIVAVTEEDLAQEVVSEVVAVELTLSLMAKVALTSDLPAPRVKSSVATVVDSVGKDVKAASVAVVAASAVVREEMTSLEEASEAETLPDLSTAITLREVVIEEADRVLVPPEAPLLSEFKFAPYASLNAELSSL